MDRGLASVYNKAIFMCFFLLEAARVFETRVPPGGRVKELSC